MTSIAVFGEILEDCCCDVGATFLVPPPVWHRCTQEGTYYKILQAILTFKFGIRPEILTNNGQ